MRKPRTSSTHFAPNSTSKDFGGVPKDKRPPKAQLRGNPTIVTPTKTTDTPAPSVSSGKAPKVSYPKTAKKSVDKARKKRKVKVKRKKK